MTAAANTVYALRDVTRHMTTDPAEAARLADLIAAHGPAIYGALHCTLSRQLKEAA